MASVMEEFRAFLNRGNIIGLAVAFVIGTAFAAVVAALVTDIINPIIGIPGKADFSSFSVNVNGSTILYGAFINSIIYFVIVALVVFFAIVRPMARMAEREAAKKGAAPPTTKECPYCLAQVPIKATKCGSCTSSLPA